MSLTFHFEKRNLSWKNSQPLKVEFQETSLFFQITAGIFLTLIKSKNQRDKFAIILEQVKIKIEQFRWENNIPLLQNISVVS